jgi:hypothetical protein
MLTLPNLQRVVIEIVFVLLGALIAWLGLTGRIFFDRRNTPWLILSVALILWGLRALWSRGQWRARWENWIRGLSLTLLGIVMLLISRVPFAFVGRLMAVGGAILVLRGLLNSVLVLRPR